MHWTQSDPAGGGYSYGDDDPINNTDLSGTSPGGCNTQAAGTAFGTNEGLSTVIQVRVHGTIKCDHRIRNVHISARYHGGQIGGRFFRATGYAGANECDDLTHKCSSDPTPNTLEYAPQLGCGETIYGNVEVWVKVHYTFRGNDYTKVHHGKLPISATVECPEG